MVCTIGMYYNKMVAVAEDSLIYQHILDKLSTLTLLQF